MFFITSCLKGKKPFLSESLTLVKIGLSELLKIMSAQLDQRTIILEIISVPLSVFNILKFLNFINLSVVDTDTYVYLYVSILGSQNVVLK